MLKLVYGCLAFSLIAGVLIVIAAAQDGKGFHGMSMSMGDALSEGAKVLDADRNGVITQTGNGRVTGFKRDGSELWSTSYDRFEEDPSNPDGADANDATAWCSGACPNALVEYDTGYTAFGTASRPLADALTTVRSRPEDVLALSTDNAAFIRMIRDGTSEPRLYVLEPGRTPSPMTAVSPGEVQPVQPTDLAVVGSAVAKVGTLSQLVRSGGIWRVAGRSTTESELKNICVSDDGDWIGAVSTRVRRFSNVGSPTRALGPAVTGGTCRVDNKGITAVVTPKADASSVEAMRYSANGRLLWVHSFGAQRLLSPAGSPHVVAQAADSTVTAIDAVSGRKALSVEVASIPFVGEDGSVVIADRAGAPEWLLDGTAAAGQ
ncbi:MAG: hypothetical protein ACSLFF_07595 [Solirubrobacterales bacterium]